MKILLSMTSSYRSRPSFQSLVDDSWGILQEKKIPFFTAGQDRAGPSTTVFIGPGNIRNSWYWELWEGFVAPVLGKLSTQPPPYQGGWGNPQSRPLVEAALRESLAGSDWSLRLTGFPT